MPAAATAMPVNPNKPAIIATMKKTNAQYNIFFSSILKTPKFYSYTPINIKISRITMSSPTPPLG